MKRRINNKAIVSGWPILIAFLIIAIVMIAVNKMNLMGNFPDVIGDSTAISTSYSNYYSIHELANDIARYSFDFALFDFSKNGGSDVNVDLSNTILTNDEKYLGLSRWSYFLQGKKTVENDGERVELDTNTIIENYPSIKNIRFYFSDYFNNYTGMISSSEIYPKYKFQKTEFVTDIKKTSAEDYKVYFFSDRYIGIPIYLEALDNDYLTTTDPTKLQYSSISYDASKSSISAVNPLIGNMFSLDVWPTSRTEISSCFGYRPKIIKGSKWHGGIDIPGPEGTAVYAVADGIVERITKAYPNNPQLSQQDDTIAIKHPNDIYTRYMHILPSVSVGQTVTKGQVIGRILRYGDYGTHLHFEIDFANIDTTQYNSEDFATENSNNAGAIIRLTGNEQYPYALDPLCFFRGDIDYTMQTGSCRLMTKDERLKRCSRYLVELPKIDKKINIVYNNAPTSDIENFKSLFTFTTVASTEKLTADIAKTPYDTTIYLYNNPDKSEISVYPGYTGYDSTATALMCNYLEKMLLTSTKTCNLYNINGFDKISEDEKMIISNQLGSKIIAIEYNADRLKSLGYGLNNIFMIVNKALYDRFSNEQMASSEKVMQTEEEAESEKIADEDTSLQIPTSDQKEVEVISSGKTSGEESAGTATQFISCKGADLTTVERFSSQYNACFNDYEYVKTAASIINPKIDPLLYATVMFTETTCGKNKLYATNPGDILPNSKWSSIYVQDKAAYFRKGFELVNTGFNYADKFQTSPANKVFLALYVYNRGSRDVVDLYNQDKTKTYSEEELRTGLRELCIARFSTGTSKCSVKTSTGEKVFDPASCCEGGGMGINYAPRVLKYYSDMCNYLGGTVVYSDNTEAGYVEYTNVKNADALPADLSIFSKQYSTLFYKNNYEINTDYNFSLFNYLIEFSQTSMQACAKEQDTRECMEKTILEKDLHDDIEYKFYIKEGFSSKYDANSNVTNFIKYLYLNKLHFESAKVISQLFECSDSEDLACNCDIFSGSDIEIEANKDQDGNAHLYVKFPKLPSDFEAFNRYPEIANMLLGSKLDFAAKNIDISPVKLILEKSTVNKFYKVKTGQLVKKNNDVSVKDCTIDKNNFILSKNTDKDIYFNAPFIEIKYNPIIIYTLSFKNDAEPLQTQFYPEDLKKAENSIVLKIYNTTSKDIAQYNVFVDGKLRAIIDTDAKILTRKDSEIDQDGVIKFGKSGIDMITDFDSKSVELSHSADYSFKRVNIEKLTNGELELSDAKEPLKKNHLYLLKDTKSDIVDNDYLAYVLVLDDVEDNIEHKITVEAIDKTDKISRSEKTMIPVDDLSPGLPYVESRLGVITATANPLNEDGSPDNSDKTAELYISVSSIPPNTECPKELEINYVKKSATLLINDNAVFVVDEEYKKLLLTMLGVENFDTITGFDYCIALKVNDASNNPKIDNYKDKKYYTELIAFKPVSFTADFLK